jgi:hypothetical protein
MKANNKLIAFFCCLLLHIQLFAQLNPPGVQNTLTLKSGSDLSTPRPVGSTDNSGSGIYNTKTNLGEETSIYFNDWSPCEVVLKDKSIITDRLLRYDIYHRQMQFILQSDTAAFGEPDEVESITFENNTFIYDEIKCKNGNRKDYLELLVDGESRLLLYRCITQKFIGDCNTPGSENTNTQYYQTIKYFISKNGNVAVPLPESKNEVIELLSDKNKDIKSFIKDNKIKLTDETDLKKLIEYYNS